MWPQRENQRWSLSTSGYGERERGKTGEREEGRQLGMNEGRNEKVNEIY